MNLATQNIIDSRLDLKILQHLEQNNDHLSFRRKLINHFEKEEAWYSLRLTQKLSFLSLPSELEQSKQINKKSLANLLDYFLERNYLASLSVCQANEYMMKLYDKLQVDLKLTTGPLVLETLHHRLAFSTNFCAIYHLLKTQFFDNIIMLHQHENPDPRLLQLQKVFRHFYCQEARLVQLNKMWFREIKKSVNDKTIIFTLGDLPNSSTQESRTLTLHYPKGSYCVKTISLADKLAKKLQAQHAMLDYGDKGEVILRKASDKLQSPLIDWVFWPAMPSLFLEANQ